VGVFLDQITDTIAEGGMKMNKKNEKKMNRNEMIEENREHKEVTKTLALADLPELDEDWLRRGANRSGVAFVEAFMRQPIGELEWFDMGFLLQNAGCGRVRCLYVYDDTYPIRCLAAFAHTVALAGGQLELAPFTLLRPVEGTTTSQNREGLNVGLEGPPSPMVPNKDPTPGLEVA